MKIFREWSKVNLRLKLGIEPSEKQAEEEFSLWCKKPFDRSMDLSFIAGAILDFAPRLAEWNRKVRSRKAHDKRWGKKSAKSS